MVAPAVMAGGMAAANVASGLFSSSAAKRAAKQAAEEARYRREIIGAVDVPTIDKLQYDLEQLVQVGSLSPEQAEAIFQEQSSLMDIESDPSLRSAQMESLSKVQDIADQDGMTLTDQARLNQILGKTGSQARGAREAVMQRFQEQGRSSPGLELVAQMQANQDASTQASNEGLNVAADAEERALQAILQSGQLGSQIRGQDFSEEAKVAEAKDAINRFNTANKQNVGLVNTAARNDARGRNLGESQRVADTNVALRGEVAKAKAASYQQDYENRLSKAKGMAGISSDPGAYANKQADIIGQTISNIGNVVGSYYDEDKRKKAA